MAPSTRPFPVPAPAQKMGSPVAMVMLAPIAVPKIIPRPVYGIFD